MMKLKTKFLKTVALSSIIFALGSVICLLSGCSFLHVHTYNTAYEYDESMHWQVCEKCGEELNVGTHAFNDFNNTCLLCGYHDSVAVVDDDGIMTGLTAHGKQKYEIDLPENVKYVTKDALKGSIVTKINIPKEFIGYYEGAFDYNNINIATDEKEVTWTFENGIYYKHNVLEEYEAVIDNQYFKTLNDAFKSVHKDDTTITIVKENLTVNEPIYVSSIINLKSYYDTTNLECEFQIAGSGILNIDSSVEYKGNAQLILVNTQEELDEDYYGVYKSGAIAFIDRETKPNDVYVEYVNNFTKTAGLGYEAVGSKQVVNDLLILPVPQYAYGAFAFSYDFKKIMGLSPYGATISELHITNVIKNVEVDINDYAFAIWTDIKINIAVIPDTHITYYQSKGSFSSLYLDYGVKTVGYRAFCNEMTDDVFPEVRGMLALLCPLKTVYIGSSVTTIKDNAFNTSLGLEEVYGGNGLTSIGEHAFSGCLSLTSVDFSESSKLVAMGKYAFSDCADLVYLSLPRDYWLINGQRFAPHQFTPEVVAYHAVHNSNDRKVGWSRELNAYTICYTKNLNKDACGKFNNVEYTTSIIAAGFNCPENGWIFIMDAKDETTQHIPYTSITKNVNMVAYDNVEGVTIGSEQYGLTVTKDHYITLDNIKPLGKVLIQCATSYNTSATALTFNNVASFGVRSEDHEIYRNTHVYYSDTANNLTVELEAKFTSAAFKEGIDYMVCGLFTFSHTTDDIGFWGGRVKNQILIEDDSVLFGSITKVTIDNPIIPNETFKVDRVDAMNDLFKCNQNIRYVTFADSMTSIGIYAFAGCTNLERVNFGNGIKYILSNAFEGCSKLRRVEFGSESKFYEMEENCFNGCSKLEYFDFNGAIKEWKIRNSNTVISTVTKDQITNPYDAAKLVKFCAQYDWRAY